MPANYVLKMSSNQQFYFNLTAENNETILTSEMHKTKSGAENGIDSVKNNSPLEERYDRRMSGDKPYFVLKAANHEVIGTSEMYSSESARENGIAAVKRVGPTASIKDQTIE